MKEILKNLVKTKIQYLKNGNDTLSDIRRYDGYCNIGILDTSIGSENVGDSIIMDSCNREIIDIFPNGYFTSFPTHINIGLNSRDDLKNKEILFACGTNMLNSTMGKSRQWNILKDDIPFYYKRVVLFGVGWMSYGKKPDSYTAQLLKSILSEKFIHSVRDSYTEQLLKGIGIENVLNTSCPTTWRLDNLAINKNKKKNVICTITDYRRDLINDSKLFDTLTSNYETVYLWIQSIKDLEYYAQLNSHNKYNLKLISPNLYSYTKFLEENSDTIDYVGTRLHAAIYALQRGIRSIIIGVDNRAIEIGKDIHISVLKRENIHDLDKVINGNLENISLPYSKIESWKKQFTKY